MKKLKKNILNFNCLEANDAKLLFEILLPHGKPSKSTCHERLLLILYIVVFIDFNIFSSIIFVFFCSCCCFCCFCVQFVMCKVCKLDQLTHLSWRMTFIRPTYDAVWRQTNNHQLQTLLPCPALVFGKRKQNLFVLFV